METFIEVLGWVGTILVLVAYMMVSYKKLDSTSKTYQVLNIVASIGMGINVFYHRSWPAFALQVIWGLIAITALYKFALKPNNK